MYSVYLKKGEEKRIIAGHPWVYANEVLKIEGKDKNGSLATVFTQDGKFIGKGYINHLSKILVRIFIRDESQVDDKAFYLEKLRLANDFRLNLGYDNCYRMVFAEADNIPALIVDKYDEYSSRENYYKQFEKYNSDDLRERREKYDQLNEFDHFQQREYRDDLRDSRDSFNNLSNSNNKEHLFFHQHRIDTYDNLVERGYLEKQKNKIVIDLKQKKSITILYDLLKSKNIVG